MGIIFTFICFVIRIVFEVATFIFINAGEFFLAVNSRANETQADTFAYNCGFGRELTSALYILQKISLNKKLKISEMLKSSHPHIAFRIEYLENMENKAYE